MKDYELGRLEKISLREVWNGEASDFTPWLGKEENIVLLGDAIGYDLEVEAQEKNVGPFRADILCKDTSDDSWVLIENQLEKTDHTHMGQLITYAAGLDAVTIVWIAERFTEEHRAALDWLNEHTDESINCFGLEIQLWKIGGSQIAPKFNMISKPNDWSRSVQRAAKGDMSEHKQTQLEFWTAFKEYMNENSKITCQKPGPHHWLVHAVGRSGFRMKSIVSLWDSEKRVNDPEIRVDFLVEGSDAKENFKSLESMREKIDQQLGVKVVWYNPEDANNCRIYVRKNADFLDRSKWPEIQKWLRENLERFHEVLSPIVKDL